MDLSALASELKKVSTYPAYLDWAGSTALLPADFNGMKYVDAAHLLSTSDTPDLRAVGLWALARCLDNCHSEILLHDIISLGVTRRTATTSDGESLAVRDMQRQLYFDALYYDATFSLAYSSLGELLSEGETVTLPDGRAMNDADLYFEALRLDPRNVEALNNIAFTLESSDSEVLSLPDGRTMNSRQLFLEVLLLDANYCAAYFNLGHDLSSKETITLYDGRTLSKRQLFFEALRCEPDDGLAYNALANCLSGRETVVLHDGRVLNKRQLYVESLRCKPTENVVYGNLSACLASNETVTLHDGRTCNSCQLYQEALRHNPQDERAKRRLIALLPLDQPWTRQSHSLVFGDLPVNRLFAALLLGLQRLETTGVLPPAHHSMLEDMLEDWTWGKSRELNTSK